MTGKASPTRSDPAQRLGTTIRGQARRYRSQSTAHCDHDRDARPRHQLLDHHQCARSRPSARLSSRSTSGRCGKMAKITIKTWALVLNSARCRILRGGAAKGDDTLAELVLRSESRHLRDIMSDKPGRSFASTGGGRRSAMEYASDPLVEDQHDFIRQVIVC